jgi:DNA-binding transcriptional LysR family regulator
LPFELRQLRYAISASEHGSFRKAAEFLRLKQSTLSRCIRQIEERMGSELFERSRSGVRPTRAGQEFLRNARRLLELAEAMAGTARAAGSGQVGRLTIGFCASISAGNLRATLIEYRQRIPEVEIRLVQDLRQRLLARVENGSIDVAVVTGEPNNGNNSAMALWTERVLITLPEHHSLASRDTISWLELSGETFLLARHETDHVLGDFLMAKLASPDHRPKIVRHEVNGEAVRGLVGAGFGVSLVSDAAVGTTHAGVVYREPRDTTGPHRIGFMAQWASDNKNPTLAPFLKLLQERYPLLPRGE